MKDKKSAKLNPQHKQDQNGHLSPSTFAKLLDPEASWDKVSLFSLDPLFTLHY
ncbi:hypothetical protein Hdeb2414_s0010g00357611 [Helianthus debilis subsp. tardiflorus]